MVWKKITLVWSQFCAQCVFRLSARILLSFADAVKHKINVAGKIISGKLKRFQNLLSPSGSLHVIQ